MSPIQKALADYQDIAQHGGWSPIPEGPKMVPGDLGERVTSLRRRLIVTGDLKKKADSDSFDEDVVSAVQNFQSRHGFEPDGTVGKETLAALNVPVERRIRQLQIAIERKKQFKDLGERYVAVNIPDYRLKVVEGGKTVLGMKVVVGQAHEWQTPLLSSQIKYLILNPKWNVPSGIFEKELIRHLRNDPTYLGRHHMKVVSTAETQGFDPAAIDWNQVNARNPHVRIVQSEGDGNSLGRIKFMFPNPYDVYLHDTPEKKFFSRDMRALSHGCVRVEKPLDLAEYVMKDDPNWPREKIVAAIKAGRNRDIQIPSPLNVFIIYITAWVDDQGEVNFRDDVYRLDEGFAGTAGL